MIDMKSRRTMQHQRSPERGLCLLTSFAMAFGLPAEKLLVKIGDGWKTVAFPGLPEPYCRRGIHIQELTAVALLYGYAVTPIELFPQVAPPTERNPSNFIAYDDAIVFRGFGGERSNWTFFNRTIESCRGIIEGSLPENPMFPFQRGHAVAFERGRIFDPDGGEYAYSGNAAIERIFFPICAWRLDEMRVY